MTDRSRSVSEMAVENKMSLELVQVTMTVWRAGAEVPYFDDAGVFVVSGASRRYFEDVAGDFAKIARVYEDTVSWFPAKEGMNPIRQFSSIPDDWDFDGEENDGESTFYVFDHDVYALSFSPIGECSGNMNGDEHFGGIDWEVESVGAFDTFEADCLSLCKEGDLILSSCKKPPASDEPQVAKWIAVYAYRVHEWRGFEGSDWDVEIELVGRLGLSDAKIRVSLV
jgi:hypothetical protein